MRQLLPSPMKFRLIGLLGVLFLCLLVWFFYMFFIQDDAGMDNYDSTPIVQINEQ